MIDENYYVIIYDTLSINYETTLWWIKQKNIESAYRYRLLCKTVLDYGQLIKIVTNLDFYRKKPIFNLIELRKDYIDQIIEEIIYCRHVKGLRNV